MGTVGKLETVLKEYFKKIEQNEITVKDFSNDFYSALDGAMDGYIHPYAREDFKKEFLG